MGRSTKAQKDFKTAKGIPQGFKDGRRKGFNTMPVKAPKTAYLGKAKKIKADLIERAKLKQSYAKVLKAEGMSSERLGTRSDKDERPERSTTFHGEASSEPRGARHRTEKNGRHPKKSDRGHEVEERKVRALSPTDIGPPLPQTSYRALKKEAFAKYHPAHQHAASKGSGQKGQPNMGARMGALLEKIKMDRTK